MLIQEHHFNLFADYYQVYIQDECSDGDLHDFDPKLVSTYRYWTGDGVLMLSTARNMTVPIAVEIHDSEPELELETCDHVTECSLEFESGTLLIAGCSDVRDDAPRIKIDAGEYRVRMEHRSLGSVAHLDGDDNYTIKLWASPMGDEITRKQWQDPDAT